LSSSATDVSQRRKQAVGEPQRGRDRILEAMATDRKLSNNQKMSFVRSGGVSGVSNLSRHWGHPNDILMAIVI